MLRAEELAARPLTIEQIAQLIHDTDHTAAWDSYLKPSQTKPRQTDHAQLALAASCFLAGIMLCLSGYVTANVLGLI